eukprot:3089646-Prorocentrum_lima.AAC.1
MPMPPNPATRSAGTGIVHVVEVGTILGGTTNACCWSSCPLKPKSSDKKALGKCRRKRQGVSDLNS